MRLRKKGERRLTTAKTLWNRLLGIGGTIFLLVSMLSMPLLAIVPNPSVTPENWWNADWKFRKMITIDHTKINDTLENFPLLIDVTDQDLAHKTQSSGNDIVFTDMDGVKLNHEIEQYNKTLGHLIAWMNIPSLSSTSDLSLYMYYGNPAAPNQQNPSAVWDSNFVMVQHLEETNGSRLDSTAYGNNGTVYGGVNKSSSGKIDGADAFNGANGYVRIPQGFLSTSAVTVELWIKPSPFSVTSWPKFINTGSTTRKGICGGQSALGADKWIFGLTWDAGGKTFSTGEFVSGYAWSHLVVTWNGTYCVSYVNGAKAKEGAISGVPDWTDRPLYLGANYYGGENFNGTVDEVRISDRARSANWIVTSYNDQNTPSAFYTFGNEESFGGAPFVSSENPSDGALDAYTNPMLSIRASDAEGDSMTILFRTNASGIWEDLGSHNGVKDGTYSMIPSSMKNLGTKYYWSVSVTDGNSWTNRTYSFTTTTTILRQKWSAINVPKTEAGVLVADVTGNSLEEVIITGNDSIAVLNGTDGSVVWNFTDNLIGTNCKSQIVDLNRDGILEIVVPLESPAGILALFGNNGSTYWRKTGLGLTTYSSLIIADIDGSGYPTIFIGSTDVYNGLNGTGRITSLSYNGTILHQTFAWRPCGGGLSIADTDSDGEFELYTGDRSMYHPDMDYGKGVRSFWARNLTERWSRPDIVLSSHIPMLADVNNDGILDVIVGHLNGGLAVFNSTDGSVINMTLGIPNDAPVHYQPSIYDIDHDGNLEMLMADAHNETSDDIVIWDLAKWKIDARMYVGKCFYGPQVADVTGDGTMEIIAANYTGIFIFDRNYSLIAQFTGLVGKLNYAVVQDIDGDGYNELVISSQEGRLYAFDTPAHRPDPRPRSEIQFYSERRLGVAEYVPPPGTPEPIISNLNPQDSVTNVSVSLPQLSFTLTDYQRDLMNYSVTTYPYIGSDSRLNASNGKYSVPVSGLQYSTTYTWNVTVTDGSHWSNRTYTFTTESMPKWWNNSWQYRKVITVNHTKIAGDLTDFSVLVDITDNDLATKAQASGDDIVFVDTNLTKLNHEIELYENATGHLIAWVNVPVLSSTGDTRLYMYYGNANASSQQNPTAVWNSGFVMVQHLEELSEARIDSTINGNNGTLYGTVGKSTSGKIDGADAFNGLNGSVRIPAGFLPTSAITVELWFKPSPYVPALWPKVINTGNTNRMGITGGKSSLTSDRWIFGLTWDSGGKSFSTGDFVSGNAWNHLALTWNGTYCVSYVNGVKAREGAVNGVPDWIGRPLYLGSNIYGGECFNGDIDEVRISSAARSSSWILTSYSNQREPASFYTMLAEEKLPAAPVITALSPYNGALGVPVSLSELTFNLTDYQNDMLNYTVVTYPDIGTGNGTNVVDGRFDAAVSNLSPSTTYTWTLNATDGTNWTNETYTFTTETTLSWWNVSWRFRREIIANHTKVNADLPDFPVLIDIVDSDLANGAKPNGDDIVFVDNSFNKLNHEIELYNASTGHLIAWVNLPLLSSTTDTRFYMYYGNPTAENQQNPHAVWDSGFVMVQHLEEVNGSRVDSTSNGNNGTPYGEVSKSLYGKIDGADAFNSLNSSLKISGSFLPTSAITVELWFKPSSYSKTSWPKFINTGPTTLRGIVAGQSTQTADKWFFGLTWDSGAKGFGTSTITSGFAWNHLIVTWNGTYCVSYVNGVKVIGGAISGTPDWAGKSLYLGSNLNYGECFNGSIDEVRISNTARSLDWIRAGYVNQENPSAFYTIGNNEMLPEGTVISVPSPSDGATRVSLSLNRLSFNLVDYSGNAMNYSVTTSPHIGSGSDTNVFNGRYEILVSSLIPSTTYTWTIAATDGTNWTNRTYTFTTYPGSLPNQDNPILVSSDGTNKTDENIICYNQTTVDADGDKLTNIYNWYRNNTSITNLLLPFDTNSSTIIKDYSGYSNDGTIVKDVQWIPDGRVGGAYKFNRGYIRIPASNALDGNGQWSEITIECWIYLTTDQWGQKIIARIPSYEIGISGTRLYAGVWIDNRLYDVMRYQQVAYDTPLGKNTWYHVTFTYKSGKGLTLYVNGVAVATTPLVSGNIQTSGTEPLYIGWFDYFEGAIDEVRIYPKSLSPQQIYQRYLETKDGLTNNSTIVSQETGAGDVWECKVTPNDSYQDGTTRTSNALALEISDKPTAYDLLLTPIAPKTSDDLVASYTYYDADGDPENGTEIRWYKNGELQVGLNDKMLVPSTLTVKGELWYFTVRPSDGKGFGRTQASAQALVINSPPTINWFAPENTTVQINEGENVDFMHVSSDPDNDTLAYSWILDQVKQSNTQNWTYTPGYSVAGTHNVVLRVSDGTVEISQQWIVKVGNVNLPPEALNLSTSPTSPFTTDTLTGSYLYYDPDGDPENGTEIFWYRNQVLQPQLNNTLIVSANETTKGDEWYFTVRPKDGIVFGDLQTSPNVTIGNSPPKIDTFTPTNTTIVINEGETIEFTHTSSDVDNDPLAYSWQLDQMEQSTTQNWTYITSFDSAGTHNVTLIVSDGELTTSQQWTVIVNNVNRAPTIDSYSPLTDPTINEGESQQFNITYSDPDGDNTTVQWYLNSTPMVSTDFYIFEANYTSAGIYNVTVIVSDGLAEASHQWTLTVLNVNLPPEASNLTISPSNPLTTDDLVGNYTYYDADENPENGTEICWFRNGILQPDLNDTLLVPANQTTKGDEWYFTVRPKDGQDFGNIQTSPIMTIQNSPPSISTISIVPNPAYTNDTLTAIPTAFDPDGDNITYIYQWQKYQNGTWENIPGATNETLGPKSFVKGDQIKVICTPYDGQEYGTPQEATITISDSPPTITSHYPETNPDPIYVGNPQEFNITCNDPDGDNLTIEWYVNGTLQETWTGNTSVVFQTGTAGTYTIEVIVSDGES
jgi:hypothetical protein